LNHNQNWVLERRREEGKGKKEEGRRRRGDHLYGY